MGSNPFDRYMGYFKWMVAHGQKPGGILRGNSPARPWDPGRPSGCAFGFIPGFGAGSGFSGVRFYRPDPLGFFRASFTYDLPRTLPVLPKRFTLPSFSLPDGRRHHSGGVALARSVGDAEEFVSLREYRPRRPLAPHPLEEFRQAGKTGGQTVPGGIFRPPHADSGHLYKRAVQPLF